MVGRRRNKQQLLILDLWKMVEPETALWMPYRMGHHVLLG